MFSGTAIDSNIAIGTNSLYSNLGGASNIAVGPGALYSNTSDYNVAIGRDSLRSTTGTLNVAVGYNAGYNETGSYKLYIANSDTATPLIYGEFNNAKLTFNGSIKLVEATREKVYTTATGFAGYTYYFKTNGAIQYITADSTANGTVNIRPSSSITTDTWLAVGESTTVILQITNGSTAYYPTAWQIDGSAVTPKWQGGTAPTGGNANAIDVYSLTITKTASATYTVLASQTKFA
jgi:hypothetical protein